MSREHVVLSRMGDDDSMGVVNDSSIGNHVSMKAMAPYLSRHGMIYSKTVLMIFALRCDAKPSPQRQDALQPNSSP